MDATMASGSMASAAYPVRLDVPYPESMSRITFLKWILVIPHLIIIYALNIVWQILELIAFFAILFTKKYPQSLYEFNVGIMRWQANATAYGYLLRDEYPPFSFDAGLYPVTMEIDRPETIGRFSPLYQWLLAIPHFIILWFLGIIAFFMIIFGGLTVLFTGTYPRGAFSFVVGVQRWSLRVTTYAGFMHNEYPPFSLE